MDPCIHNLTFLTESVGVQMEDLDFLCKPYNHMNGYLYPYPIECILTIRNCLSPSYIDFREKNLPKTEKET